MVQSDYCLHHGKNRLVDAVDLFDFFVEILRLMITVTQAKITKLENFARTTVSFHEEKTLCNDSMHGNK